MKPPKQPPRIVQCICGHSHAHKSRCTECPCRYGTDNRKASNRAIVSRANSGHPGFQTLRKYFTPENIAQALIEERTNGNN